jgi:putative transcriptional regulator
MNDVFKSIEKGLLEAIDHAKGGKEELRLFTPQPVDVKDVREKTGLTQKGFSAMFGISVSTLRHWERGDRSPHGPALVLLNAASKDPKGLLKILHS